MESSVDWCEGNYVMSNYIAEYYNTITGIFIAISAVFFRYKQPEVFENVKYGRHFYKIYNLLFLTSIGTVLFHGTLMFPFQLLDELPMLYIAIEYTNILLTFYTNNKKNFLFKIDSSIIKTLRLLKKTIYFIPLSYYFGNIFQILHFHFLLKCFETMILYLLYNISLETNKIGYIKISENNSDNVTDNMTDNMTNISVFKNKIINFLQIKKDKSYYTKCGILIYSTSIFIWVFENMFCSHVQRYQLHAIWHIMSSIGIYHLNNIMLCYAKIDDTK